MLVLLHPGILSPPVIDPRILPWELSIDLSRFLLVLLNQPFAHILIACLGSICLGSMIVAILTTLRRMLDILRNQKGSGLSSYAQLIVSRLKELDISHLVFCGKSYHTVH